MIPAVETDLQMSLPPDAAAILFIREYDALSFYIDASVRSDQKANTCKTFRLYPCCEVIDFSPGHWKVLFRIL